MRQVSGGGVRVWLATLYGSLEELVERGRTMTIGALRAAARAVRPGAAPDARARAGAYEGRCSRSSPSPLPAWSWRSPGW